MNAVYYTRLIVLELIALKSC